jgi:type VI secretion system protein ImpA
MENGDATRRRNALLSLNDYGFILGDLRKARLVYVPRIGPISLSDIEIAKGVSKPGKDPMKLEVSAIDAAFDDCDTDELQESANAVRESITSVNAIQTLFMDKAGVNLKSDFKDLVKMLTDANIVLSEQLKEDDVGASTAEARTDAPASGKAAGAEAARSPGAPFTGEITSRQDVVQTLDKICAYYEREEPSSPVPILLGRARRLASMNFMDIIKDLAPNALSQLEQIRGPEKEQAPKPKEQSSK